MIGAFFDQRNIPYIINDLYAGDEVPNHPSDYRAVIVLGGPMNVDDDEKYPYLTAEKQFIKDCVDHKVPFLGICLGSQLLACALGADVYKNTQSEIGWLGVDFTEDGKNSALFKGLQSPLPVFHWHGDTFDIPEGAKHLASSGVCKNQAFSVGAKAFGLQFHLEVTCEEAANWARAYLPDCNENDAKDAQRLIDQPEPEKEKNVAMCGELLLTNFISLSGS